MENENLNKIKLEFKKVALTSQEKELILKQVLIQPLIKPEPTKTWGQFNWFQLTVAMVMIVIVIGTGTSLAAESSLPGDLLYQIKTKINEPLRGAVAVSPQAKVEWESTKIDRRLKEAETLADKQQLDETKRQDLEVSINQQVETFGELTKDSTSTEEIKSSFTNKLKRYSQAVEERVKQDNHEEGTTSSQTRELKKLDDSIKNKVEQTFYKHDREENDQDGGNSNRDRQNGDHRRD